MIGRLVSFCEGKTELYTEAKYRDKLVSIIANENIKSKIISEKENGGIKVILSPQNAKKIAAALDKSNIIVYINSVCGLKAMLVSRCKRVGMLLGVIAFFTLLSLSTMFVFKVEVSGSELISAQDVKAELSDFGIRVGARLSGIDRTAAANRFLQLHPELSWAAINFRGTTVCLELKEKAEPPPQSTEIPDFLVADRDGVVQNVLVYSGKPAVSQNTVVKKGDLLISGYISGSGLQFTDNPQLRYEGAGGKVLALVNESVSESVLLNEVTVTEKRGQRLGVTVEIFGKKIKFGKTEEGLPAPEKNLTLWGKIELPITYTESYAVTKTESTAVRDELQAVNEAKSRAYESLSAKLGDAELCQTELIVVSDGEKVTVTVNYVCIRDIAVPKMKE